MDEIAIKIQSLRKKYNLVELNSDKKRLGRYTKEIHENYVLNGIDLTVKKGEVLGIVGRNGCGKSTLLKIISKITPPTEGVIECDGKIASILELGMGFHPDLTGRENIIIKGEMYGFSKKQIESKLNTIIKHSGIEKYIDNPLRTYSSGMTARLAFSIMINVDADIILVDEVLSVGDSSFSEKAKQHFTKLSKSGKTILFVSHNTNAVEQLCTRCILIEKGKIIADDKPNTICYLYHKMIDESPEILLDLAQNGVAESQFKIALMYKNGINYPKDIEKYEDWVKKSSEQQYVPAQIEYASCLISKKDDKLKKKAIDLLISAAEKGNTDARNKLSKILSNNEDDLKIIKNIYSIVTED